MLETISPRLTQNDEVGARATRTAHQNTMPAIGSIRGARGTRAASRNTMTAIWFPTRHAARITLDDVSCDMWMESFCRIQNARRKTRGNTTSILIIEWMPQYFTVFRSDR